MSTNNRGEILCQLNCVLDDERTTDEELEQIVRAIPFMVHKLRNPDGLAALRKVVGERHRREVKAVANTNRQSSETSWYYHLGMRDAYLDVFEAVCELQD